MKYQLQSEEKEFQNPNFVYVYYIDSDGKEFACNAGDPDSFPGLERSRGEGNGNPLQYSCWGNSMDGGAWQESQRVRHD